MDVAIYQYPMSRSGVGAPGRDFFLKIILLKTYKKLLNDDERY